MTYKYESPTERGYTQIKLTKAEHNVVFKYRKKTIFRSSEYFYKDGHFIAHHFAPLWWVCLLAIPALIIMTFYSGVFEAWEDVKRALRPKHYGSFTGDSAHFKIMSNKPQDKPIIDAYLHQTGQSIEMFMHSAHVREYIKFRKYTYLAKMNKEFCIYNLYSEQYEWHSLKKDFKCGYTMYRGGFIEGWR